MVKWFLPNLLQTSENISLSIASTVVVFDKIKKINIFLIEYVINVLPFDRFFYSLIAV